MNHIETKHSKLIYSLEGKAYQKLTNGTILELKESYKFRNIYRLKK